MWVHFIDMSNLVCRCSVRLQIRLAAVLRIFNDLEVIDATNVIVTYWRIFIIRFNLVYIHL